MYQKYATYGIVVNQNSAAVPVVLEDGCRITYRLLIEAVVRARRLSCPVAFDVRIQLLENLILLCQLVVKVIIPGSVFGTELGPRTLKVPALQFRQRL